MGCFTNTFYKVRGTKQPINGPHEQILGRKGVTELSDTLTNDAVRVRRKHLPRRQ